MRNPNGYGGVVKLGGNRRRPFGARICTGRKKNGTLKYKYIGYYKTHPEAVAALVNFNNSPYDLENRDITFKEVYEKWKVIKFKKIGKSAKSGYNAALKQITIHKPIRKIKAQDMQLDIDNCDQYGMKRKIKTLFKQVFKYSMQNDIISKDYTDYIDVGKKTKKTDRRIFTDFEIKRLIQVANEIDYADTVLIMIYSGLRVGELFDIKDANIGFENDIMVGGSKTDAGKDRVIPIHPRIMPYIKKRVETNHEYLVTNFNGSKMK